MLKETHARYDKTMRWSLAAALVLHLIVIALSRLSVERPLSAPQEDAIPVKFLVSAQMDAPVKPSEAGGRSAPLAAPRSTESVREEARRALNSPTKETDREPGAMIRATQLFSAGILADPRSRNALDGLRQLATGERIVQLCNVEAMEQVHRWKAEFQPDFLVAYAMADTVLSGRALRADGGALRSKGNWYNIKYRCEVSPDIARVAAFEFAVGTEIPREEWEAHSLTANDGPADQESRGRKTVAE
jgi:hypothetical protein